MNDFDLGKKIAHYRKLKNFSIKNLAQEAQVTSSLLSQIERGLANPSINTLKNISSALGVPLFSFFIESIDSDELIVRSNERKKISISSSDDVIYELLSPNLKGAIEFALMTLNPQSQSSSNVHFHEGEEAAYVLKGCVQIQINSEFFDLSEGDSIKILPKTKHLWKNLIDEEAKILFAVTPPSF